MTSKSGCSCPTVTRLREMTPAVYLSLTASLHLDASSLELVVSSIYICTHLLSSSSSSSGYRAESCPQPHQLRLTLHPKDHPSTPLANYFKIRSAHMEIMVISAAAAGALVREKAFHFIRFVHHIMAHIRKTVYHITTTQ